MQATAARAGRARPVQLQPQLTYGSGADLAATVQHGQRRAQAQGQNDWAALNHQDGLLGI